LQKIDFHINKDACQNCAIIEQTGIL